MRKLALLLSLLALGALGLAACGGGDEGSTAASETVTVTTFAPRLSLEQQIERTANRWAPLFANGPRCNRFMGQPACVRIACERPGNRPIKNCTPPTDGFVNSFGDATVRDVAIKGDRAAAEFSNGGVIVLDVGDHHWGGPMSIVKVGGNAGRGSFDNTTDTALPLQQIERSANKWAQLFADGPRCNRYMGQPACERADCERVSTGTIKNCTPLSPEFRQSFADATVERVVVEGHHTTADFSNGESVEFEGQKADEGDPKGVGHWAWFITEKWIKAAGRR
jgi:hypothetical protein